MRDDFSVSTILNSTGWYKLLRQECLYWGLRCGEFGIKVTWHTKLHPKWAPICNLCRFQHSFISQRPENSFCVIWYGKQPTITIVLAVATVMGQVTARWQCCGMTGDHGDNPWKFRNHVVVSGTQNVLRPAKLIRDEEQLRVTHYGVVSKRNWISIWVEFLIGEFILKITFPFNRDHCGEYQQPIAQVSGA